MSTLMVISDIMIFGKIILDNSISGALHVIFCAVPSFMHSAVSDVIDVCLQ